MNNLLSSVTNITNNNPQSQQPPAVAERADVHKSCKSLETLLNVLNDYCEAATAVVTLQKKLAKALRDTAGSKITNEIAGNTLTASANIFDALAEVDTKFVKIADKEYDAISTEVKRWFKKLAKEEKAHDDRIANANAKIKQAGLNFEKKSKKKAADAQDEHSRYIHLISTLGPEITQEKHNHSSQVAQRHTITIYNVAACLARIADTEWTRSCESVRRFAPTVGLLGEWRSLCEGGWTKELPGDLPILDDKAEDKLLLNTIQERVEPEEEKGDEQTFQRQLQAIPARRTPKDGPIPGNHPHQHLNPPRNERESTSSSSQTQSSSPANSPTLPRYPQNPANATTPPNSNPILLTPVSMPKSPQSQTSVSPAGSTSASPRVQSQGYPTEHSLDTPTAMFNNQLRPPSPISHPSQSQSRDPSPTSDRERLFSDPATGSVRSLSAFPTPPTHFPLPPPRARDPPATATSRPSVEGTSKDEQTPVAKERLSESPLPMEYPEERQPDSDIMLSPPQQKPRRRQSGDTDNERERRMERQLSNLGRDAASHPAPSPNPGGISRPEPTTPNHQGGLHLESTARTPLIEKEEFRARDFGVVRGEQAIGASGRAHTFGGGVPDPRNTSVEFPSASYPSQRRDVFVERTDTGTSSSGSIVAAMKNRYYSTPGSRSPPPRVGDLPRLHTSVTEMANRYQSPPPQGSGTPPSVAHSAGDSITEIGELREHQSPRGKQTFLRTLTKSPPPLMGRNISNPEKTVPRQNTVSSSSMTPTLSPRPLPAPGTPKIAGMRESVDGSEDRVHWRRVEARERELLEREQELTLRERELERDRVRLLVLRDGLASSSPSANESEHGNHSASEARDSAVGYQTGQIEPRRRERRISLRRSRQDSHPKTPPARQELLLPPSQGNLGPSISSPNLRERHQSQHSYSSPPSSNLSTSQVLGSSTTLASDSGNSSYLSRSTGSPLQPQEKKGGWMRRLSMPVGNALPFSLDSSKRHANNSNSSTTSNTSANVSSPKAGTRNLGAGILGGKGVTANDRRHSTSVARGLGAPDSSDQERGYGYEQKSQYQDEQDRGRFGGFGLGRKSYDASRSATNLNFGRNK